MADQNSLENYGINPWLGVSGAALGTGLGGLFGHYKDPYKEASKYYNQIPGTINQSFSPYIGAGQQALPGLQEQYGNLLHDPGSRLNQIGQGFQQSPGLQFQIQQALQGAGHAAAAGGMAGSPQHEQQNMELATNLANQDYNHWIQNALGLYGTGLSGEQGLYNTGAEAGMRGGEDIASALAQQGRLGFEGRNLQNMRSGGNLGSLLGGLGSLGGLALSGPFKALSGLF